MQSYEFDFSLSHAFSVAQNSGVFGWTSFFLTSIVFASRYAQRLCDRRTEARALAAGREDLARWALTLLQQEAATVGPWYHGASFQ